jgi:hypothetical protein
VNISLDDVFNWLENMQKDVQALMKGAAKGNSTLTSDSSKAVCNSDATLESVRALMPDVLAARTTNGLDLGTVRSKNSSVRNLMLQYLRDVSDVYMVKCKSATTKPTSQAYRSMLLILSSFVLQALTQVGYEASDCPQTLIADLLKNICKGAKARMNKKSPREHPDGSIDATDSSSTPSSATQFLSPSLSSTGMSSRTVSSSTQQSNAETHPVFASSELIENAVVRTVKRKGGVKKKGKGKKGKGKPGFNIPDSSEDEASVGGSEVIEISDQDQFEGSSESEEDLNGELSS